MFTGPDAPFFLQSCLLVLIQGWNDVPRFIGADNIIQKRISFQKFSQEVLTHLQTIQFLLNSQKTWNPLADISLNSSSCVIIKKVLPLYIPTSRLQEVVEHDKCCLWCWCRVGDHSCHSQRAHDPPRTSCQEANTRILEIVSSFFPQLPQDFCCLYSSLNATVTATAYSHIITT